FTSPSRWRQPEWTVFAAEAAAVGIGALADNGLRDDVRDLRSSAADHITRTFEPLGSYGAFGVLGVFYLDGLVFRDARARNVAVDGLVASGIAAGVITPALKFVVGRSRPRDNLGTHHFSPGSGRASFPSGHATEAFAVAGVIADSYDAGWVKALSYGTAALVGFARIRHDAHFTTDVVAGALIGAHVGHTVAHHNRNLRGRFSVAPLLGRNGDRGISISTSF
ncbi:MAG: phosphatase PAP2 family protein, partial [Acidobacteriota bacterium]|nr:phosphatase PAP2 family protein [Acidobacteriota bacterium]